MCPGKFKLWSKCTTTQWHKIISQNETLTQTWKVSPWDNNWQVIYHFMDPILLPPSSILQPPAKETRCFPNDITQKWPTISKIKTNQKRILSQGAESTTPLLCVPKPDLLDTLLGWSCTFPTFKTDCSIWYAGGSKCIQNLPCKVQSKCKAGVWKQALYTVGNT